MKKIIFGGIAIVVIAVVAALSVNLKSNEYGLSELGLNNAEALAGDPPSICYLPRDFGICNLSEITTYCYYGM